MPFAKVSQDIFHKVSYKIFHQLPKSAIELKSLVKSASKIVRAVSGFLYDKVPRALS